MNSLVPWSRYHRASSGPNECWIVWSGFPGNGRRRRGSRPPPAGRAGLSRRRPGDAIGHEYDFGDRWIHQVTLDKVTARPAASCPAAWPAPAPAPPEDSGGPFGYQAALEGLRARKGWRYRIARETLGRGFNPAAFDKDEVNQQLAGLAPAAS